MIPTSLLSEITSTAPTALSAILSIASYTVWSGVTNQTSLPFRFKTEPIVPVIFIIAWSPLMRRFLADRKGKGIGGNYALGGPESTLRRVEDLPSVTKPICCITNSAEGVDYFVGGVGSGGAGQAVAGVGAGAAKEEVADGGFVAGPVQDGTHGEELIEG